MSVDAHDLQVRGRLVEDVARCVKDGGFSLTHVPNLLRQLLDNESWRRFETQLGQVVEHETFASFVTTRPLAGLGATPEMLRRIVADDKELAGLLARAFTGQHGGDRSKPAEPEEQALQCNSCSRGHRADYGVVVLKENEPEQYAAVIAGERSVHAALVAVGRRKPYVSVRVDDPAAAARTLRKKLTVEQRHELARLLVEEN
jgi:hypothetical protein